MFILISSHVLAVNIFNISNHVKLLLGAPVIVKIVILVGGILGVLISSIGRYVILASSSNIRR